MVIRKLSFEQVFYCKLFFLCFVLVIFSLVGLMNSYFGNYAGILNFEVKRISTSDFKSEKSISVGFGTRIYFPLIYMYSLDRGHVGDNV